MLRVGLPKSDREDAAPNRLRPKSHDSNYGEDRTGADHACHDQHRERRVCACHPREKRGDGVESKMISKRVAVGVRRPRLKEPVVIKQQLNNDCMLRGIDPRRHNPIVRGVKADDQKQ